MDVRVLRQYLAFAALNGLWFAGLVISYFDALPLEERFQFTLLVLLSISGAAATYASYARGFHMLVLVALPPLAFQWWHLGTPSALIIAVTMVAYGMTMLGFSRNLAAVFEGSVQIRFERESIVEALRQQQKQTEIERQKAEDASRAKSRFLANASHDLRQPAQALALYTAVLQRVATTDEQSQISANIARASRASGDLLSNLLDLSRLDAGAVTARRERVGLHALLSRLAAESAHVAQERGVAVRCACPLLVVETDPFLLERLLRKPAGERGQIHRARQRRNCGQRTRRTHSHRHCRHRARHLPSASRTGVRGILPGRQPRARS